MVENTSTSNGDSLGTRIINIFASPGEAFLGMKQSEPKVSYWLITFLLLCFFMIFFMYTLATNDALREEIFDMQAKAMQEQVDKGKMTQTQVDQIRSQMDKASVGMFVLFGSIPVLFFLAVYFFLGTLIFWLIGKTVFKSTAGYGTYLGMYGLSSWIAVLGAIITLLLVLNFQTIKASPGLGLLFMDTLDLTKTTDKIIAGANIFSLWQAIVIGFGFSALSDKSKGMGIGVALGLWVLWVVIAALIGIG